MVESHADLQTRYEDFLRLEQFHQVERISTAVDDFTRLREDGSIGAVGLSPRVRILLPELRSEIPQLASRLRTDPLRHIRALEWACHAVATEERPGYDKSGERIKISIVGPVSAAPLSPRGLTSSQLGKLVCVEGVATKVSTVRQKLVKSVHYCPSTKQHETRSYVDGADPELGLPALDANGRELADKLVAITPSAYPSTDRDGNPLQSEFGLSKYTDYQTITLQEMPERAPMGQLPRSVDLQLSGDLVDTLKPGDRVHIVGVYRAIPKPSASFRSVLLVSHLQLLSRDQVLSFQVSDVRHIRELASRPDILSILGRSMSPFIHGHEVAKKALILQLLSGCEKNLPNGTHLRGDINILLLGDPSTAKSQLLRTVLQIAPLAVSTTGKGSSGVGLTAAVTNDPETRERRLEAGAMVLADRGVVCIDEFDKMSEIDRVAIHEVMEQQTVTIAKAGIHATLNARCSVLAAANPVYGQYDRKRRLQENIGLPDSLLSRFDLLFVFLDNLEPVSDRRISTHVIRAHRNTNHSLLEDDYLDDDDAPGASTPDTIWQKAHQSFTADEHNDDDDPHSKDVLRHDFLRKFIHFAKTRYKPILTDEAREAIAIHYAELRSRSDERTLPITARSLETIIRLATAHAKARLSDIVEAEPDVLVATDILSYALYHENHHNISTNNEIGQQSSPNLVDDEEDLEPDSKKLRVSSSSLSSLKQRIWQELSAQGEGTIEEIYTSYDETREFILKVLQELEADNKIMIVDDLVVTV